MAKLAKDCKTMSEVRAGVDEVDRQLVQLMAKRQTYMAAAARIKQSREKVYDKARIDEVLAKVGQAAKKSGLSEVLAENVWKVLIKQSIDYEFEQWDKIRKE